jgi:hypothetical protein
MLAGCFLLPGGGIRGCTCRHERGRPVPGDHPGGAAVTEGAGAVRIDRVDAARAWPAGPTAAGYRAVQQDIAVTVVDWPVVHAWAEDDPDFVGAVTVLDGAGRQLVTADWPAPTDDSADSSLSGMGWRRVGPWERDWLGRRAALVTPVRALPRQADR